MGGNTSVDQQVKITTSDMVNIVNSAVNSCTSSLNEKQQISLQNVAGCPITISHIDFSQIGTVNLKCVQSVNNQTKVKQALQQQVATSVKAISSALGLSSTHVNELTNLVTTLATNIYNTSSQSVNSAISENQAIILKNIYGKAGANCAININMVNFKTIGKNITKSIQKNKNVTNAQSELKSALKQWTKAKSKGLLTTLLIIAVIALVIYYLRMQSVRKAGGGIIKKAPKAIEMAAL